jgi:hypothetical protein
VAPRSTEEQAAFEKFKAAAESKKGAAIWPSNYAFVPPKTPKSKKKAANSCDMNAQYELGVLSLKRKPPNLVKARKWFAIAAQAGHVLAQHDLGVMTFNGDGGRRDPIEGCMWLALASAQGVKTEMFAKEAAMMTNDEVAEARMMARDWKTAYSTARQRTSASS